MPRTTKPPEPESQNLELEVAALRAVLGALPVRAAAVLLPAPSAATRPAGEGTGDHAEPDDEA